MLGKTELLAAIAGKNRGLLASKRDQQAILAAIAQLEDYNPTPRPLEAAELLEGDWLLLYTTSRDLLGFDKLPFCQLGAIYQCLRVEHQRVYNIAEILSLPGLNSLVSVAAGFIPTSERRVQVRFERAILGFQGLLGYQSPQVLIEQIESLRSLRAIDFKINSDNQQGWLDITYLDRDLRIGRGNEGSVFVLSRVPR